MDTLTNCHESFDNFMQMMMTRNPLLPDLEIGMTSPVTLARQSTMRVLADARCDEIEQGLTAGGFGRDYIVVRGPELGLVMIRGRIGGDGPPFNVGEATVMRTVVRLADGTLGFSYLLGREAVRSELAALVDALWQRAESREAIERCVLAPIRERVTADEQARAAKVAATRVEFFTMQRGED